MARNRKPKPSVQVPIKDRTLTDCVDENLVDNNVVIFRVIQDELVDIYAKKNHDYGDSFNEGCNELGVAYAFSRIFDKTKRFQTLAKGILNNNVKIEVQDETIEDTIMDLANYCVMYLAWKGKTKIYVGEAEAKQCAFQVSSTGELESNKNTSDTQESVEEYYEIDVELHNGTSKLISEQLDYTCTDEVIYNYGICLYKDKNDYVYTKTIHDEFVNVTYKDRLVKVVPNK